MLLVGIEKTEVLILLLESRAYVSKCGALQRFELVDGW